MLSIWRTVPFYTKGTAKHVIRRFHRRHGLREREVPSPFSLLENRGYVPTLSPSQVTSILNMNESTMHVKHFGRSPVRGFESNQLASNNPIEDRRAVGQQLQTEGYLFGVYDGHGGCACAQAIQERLFDYIAAALLPLDILEEFSHRMHTDEPMEIMQRFRHVNEYTNTEMTKLNRNSLHKFVAETLSTDLDDQESSFTAAMENAFLRLDNDISAEALPVGGMVNLEAVEVALSGACALVAHIAGVHVHVANTGDCRAVLGQFENGAWQAIPLSMDHNSENEQEVERIKMEHPKSEHANVIKNNRLLGQLAPLRAFGDVRYKWNVKDLKFLENVGTYGQSLIAMNYQTPPYLTAKPDILYHRLGPRDKFLILASDGLWEHLPDHQVVRLVGEHMHGRQTPAAFEPHARNLKLGSLNTQLLQRKQGLANRAIDTNSATHLIRNALGLQHQKLSAMLTLPPHAVRFYRDDITVTVIFFDDEYIVNQA